MDKNSLLSENLYDTTKNASDKISFAILRPSLLIKQRFYVLNFSLIP